MALAERTAPEKRPRTASRAVRRRQLIEATIASIARHGLSGTTMATVTGIAGLSQGIVSYHFRSKANLLRQTLVFLAEEHRDGWVRSLADASLAPEAKLAAMIDAHFHPGVCNENRISVWYAFFGEARYRKVYREKIAEFDTERSEVGAELCRRIVEEGGYSGIDPAGVIKTLESLSDGLWLNMMLYPGWFTAASARRQIHAYLAAVFPRTFAAWPTASGPTEVSSRNLDPAGSAE